MEMTRKEELVLWVLQMVCGVDGQQQRWWWKIPFAFSSIQPFEEVLHISINGIKRGLKMLKFGLCGT
ncbi:hypothetical protein HKD37_05G012856 [Glycine soja]